MAHVAQIVKVQGARLSAMPRGARLYERLHEVKTLVHVGVNPSAVRRWLRASVE